ncbi:MAG: NADH:ubiquinone reductase (Na(+)-transporting) subunit C [Prevotellaceae bacterium]|jgi:Na+-transporting NADH:ubiquinone oxidoreductase subunit C|nr:NADH:ubiquinone reductase (Na(+)-transporting) subunit C [Prevotellaceae bacterium]
MNTNSNTYTVIYSAILVIIVAAALAFAAGALKVPQEKNIEIEKKMNILMSVGKAADAAQVTDKNAYIEDEYKKYIVEEYLVNVKGEKVEGNAFATDLKAELQKTNPDNRTLPVFVCSDNGKTLYILPVRGAGLWGAIWGYISVENDFNTVFGANFDHVGETPGLGAEIATPAFQKQFAGKKLYDADKFVSVEIIKPGSVPVNEHNVDGISGGTITSKAVGAMLFNCLSNYQAFFAKQKRNQPLCLGKMIVVEDGFMVEKDSITGYYKEIDTTNYILIDRSIQ